MWMCGFTVTWCWFSLCLSCESQPPLSCVLCVRIPITCFVLHRVIPDPECTGSCHRSGSEVPILFVLRVSFHLAHAMAVGRQPWDEGAGVMRGEGAFLRSSTSLDDLKLSYNSTTTFTAQDVGLANPHPSEYSNCQVYRIHFWLFLWRNKIPCPRSHRTPVEKLQTE